MQLVERNALRVMVGEAECSNLRVVNWKELQCDAPAGDGFDVPVSIVPTIAVPGILDPIIFAGSLNYTTPLISSVSPAAGNLPRSTTPGSGSLIEIVGSGFGFPADAIEV